MHTNLDRTTFYAERSYDNAGQPLKPMRNWLAELGYEVTRKPKTLKHILEKIIEGHCGETK